MEDKKTYDEAGNLLNITKADFALVNTSGEVKVQSEKIETKSTTFAKDAFKRFCKNKASVVAAVIIGLLVILSLFQPLFSKYDVKNTHVNEIFMPSKLFGSGFGFWDGTRKITNVELTSEDAMPAGFDVKYIQKLTKYQIDGKWYADFRYDYYGATYGDQEKTIAGWQLERWKEAGYVVLTYDTLGNITTVQKTSDKKLAQLCPIVTDEVLTVTDEEVTTVISMYKYYGYKTMPKFLFGTDELGRDLLTNVFTGLRSSLLFSICISLVCFAFGLLWGSVSGYFGGNVDLAMERFKDILGGVPLVIIVTLFRLNLGDGFFVFALSLCFTGWMSTAARTRTQFYRFKGREYVLASRTLGASDTRLIFKHILPNSLGTIVTSSVLLIPSFIFIEASLSYLGLGLQNTNSFGTILAENQKYLQNYPNLVILPAVIISLLMISFNLFGNGLRDALNPSLKGSE